MQYLLVNNNRIFLWLDRAKEMILPSDCIPKQAFFNCWHTVMSFTYWYCGQEMTRTHARARTYAHTHTHTHTHIHTHTHTHTHIHTHTQMCIMNVYPNVNLWGKCEKIDNLLRLHCIQN